MGSTEGGAGTLFNEVGGDNGDSGINDDRVAGSTNSNTNTAHTTSKNQTQTQSQFNDSDLLFYILVPLLSAITPELLRGLGSDSMVDINTICVSTNTIYAHYLCMNNITTKPSIVDSELRRGTTTGASGTNSSASTDHMSGSQSQSQSDDWFDYSTVSLVQILSCAAQAMVSRVYI